MKYIRLKTAVVAMTCLAACAAAGQPRASLFTIARGVMADRRKAIRLHRAWPDNDPNTSRSNL
jgi:DNA-directed RNA polymerase specialized sigma24 family protein